MLIVVVVVVVVVDLVVVANGRKDSDKKSVFSAGERELGVSILFLRYKCSGSGHV